MSENGPSAEGSGVAPLPRPASTGCRASLPPFPPTPARTACRSPHSPPATAPPAVPDHELIKCIGQGSFGEVWLARTVMGTYWAVKIVYRHAFDHPRPYEREFEGIRRFEPVSRRHESQLAVLHVGRNDDAGCFYYVMELADDAQALTPTLSYTGGGSAPAPPGTGKRESLRPESYIPRTLQYELHQRGRLPVEECLRIGLSLTTALQHLHEHGLIHRDIKPSNIIFVEGVPKLADVGLVATLDATMSLSGTPGYIAPEGSGTPRADIYSLAKVIYEMSMGRDRVEFPKLPPDFALLPERQLLLELNAVLLKAGHGDPAQRYQTAAEMHADLALIRSGKSVKRLRWLEHHVVLARRVAVAVMVVCVLIAGAWWQTWRAHRIANRHLIELQVKESTQQIMQGNNLAAVAPLVEALRLTEGDRQAEAIQRARLASVLRQCPLPMGMFSSGEGPILSADINADGTLLATASGNHPVRLWGARTGELLRSLPRNSLVHSCQFLGAGDTLLTWGLTEAKLWNLDAEPASTLTVPHFVSVAAGRVAYCLGFNSKLGIAYLSKATYRFARTHPFHGPYEQLGLRLTLVAETQSVTLRYEFRDLSRGGAVRFAGEFCDTPRADRLEQGRDTPPGPCRGTVFLLLSDLAFGERTNDTSRVAWDNARMRCFPTSAGPPARWDVNEDFSDGTLHHWLTSWLNGPTRELRVEHGQLVMVQHRLSPGQSGSSAAYMSPVELQAGYTLEVEADVVGAHSARPAAEITLFWPYLDQIEWSPVLSPDGEFLAVSQASGATRLWDLRRQQFRTIVREGQESPLELLAATRPNQVHFSPDSRHLAGVVGDQEEAVVWDVQTGDQVPLDLPMRQGCRQVRFSPTAGFWSWQGKTDFGWWKPGNGRSRRTSVPNRMPATSRSAQSGFG